MSDTFIEQILLSLGDKAPWLIFFVIFVKYMWPDIVGLVQGFLDYREECAKQPDPMALKVDQLGQNIATLVSTLNMFVSEYRAYIFRSAAAPLAGIAPSFLTQPPVSPTSANAVQSSKPGVASDGGAEGSG